jgi:hypothetical protein
MAVNRLEAEGEHQKKQNIKEETRRPNGWYPGSGTGIPIPQDEVNKHHGFGKPFPDVGFGSEYAINYFGRVYEAPKRFF